MTTQKRVLRGEQSDPAGGRLAEAGVFGMIVGYYRIGFVVERLLSVRLINPSAGGVAKAA
jgi:hypothetical protein